MYGFVKPDRDLHPLTFSREYFDIDRPEEFWKITRKTLRKRRVDTEIDGSFLDQELFLLKRKAQLKQMIKDAEKISENRWNTKQEIIEDIERTQKVNENQVRKLIMLLITLVNAKDHKVSDNIKKMLKYLNGVYGKDELAQLVNRNEENNNFKYCEEFFNNKDIQIDKTFWTLLEGSKLENEQIQSEVKNSQFHQEELECDDVSCRGSNLGDLWKKFNKNINSNYDSNSLDLVLEKESNSDFQR